MSFINENFNLSGSQIVTLCAHICAYAYARSRVDFRKQAEKFDALANEFLEGNLNNIDFVDSVNVVLQSVLANEIESTSL